MNATPSLLAVSLNRPRYTASGIRENKTFSVNIPGANMDDVHELPTNDLFIGEVVEAYINRSCFVDGRPEVRMINPFF